MAETGPADADGDGVHAEFVGDFVGGVAFQASFEHGLFDWGQTLVERLDGVLVLGGLGGGFLGSGQGLQGFDEKGAAIFGAGLAAVGAPFPGDFAADDGASQGDEFVGVGDIKALIADPHQQAVMDGLHDVDRIEVGSEKGAEEDAGHDPNLLFVLLAEFELSLRIPSGCAIHELGKVEFCTRFFGIQACASIFSVFCNSLSILLHSKERR